MRDGPKVVRALPQSAAFGSEVLWVTSVPGLGRIVRRMMWLGSWVQTGVGGLRTGGPTTRSAADAVTSNSINTEVNVGYRVDVPAAAGDLIEASFVIFIVVGATSAIADFAFATLDAANALVSAFPARGTKNPFYFQPTYDAVGVMTAKYKVTAADVWPDGRVRVTPVVDTANISRTFGAVDRVATIDLLNHGQVS